MNLDELEALADAAREEITNPKGRLHFFSTQFYNATSPQTIKQLIALVRLQHEALNLSLVFMETPPEMRKVQPWTQCHDALAAYEAFEKGEVK